MANDLPPRKLKAVIKDPQHCKRVVSAVQLFHSKNDFFDLCFVCARGQRVYAHKLLLCSVSTRMKEMFLELPDNIDLITIHLPDIEKRLLRLLLEYLYEGALTLSTTEYDEFEKLMDLLGIVKIPKIGLTSPNDRASQSRAEVIQLQPQPPAVQPQARQLVYVQAPNSQGQLQYMLATQASISQGQIMQMAPASGSLPQGQVMQMASASGSLPQGQVMQVTSTSATLPQGQVMQVTPVSAQPVMMSQTNGQMVQAGSQLVSTQMQQSNMMQVVPQNSTQVVPMVAGNQIVQCSSQMVVQGSQQTMINNQMPINIQNQVVQPTNQSSQYVMSSTANQMAPSRARAHYSSPQTITQQRTVGRTRVNQVVQPARNNTLNNVAGSLMKTDIHTILQENCSDIETLTARQLRDILEPKLGIDLSKQEQLIEHVLKSCQKGTGESVSDSVAGSTSDTGTTPQSPVKRRSLRTRTLNNLSLSDDENDEDFDPKNVSKKSRKKRFKSKQC